MVEMRMPYRTYKNQFASNKTVAGSYDSKTKTIVILIDEKRANIIEKKAGTSLNQFYSQFTDNNTSEKFGHMFNYFTEEGLEKQIKQYEKNWNCKRIQRVF